MADNPSPNRLAQARSAVNIGHQCLTSYLVNDETHRHQVALFSCSVEISSTPRQRTEMIVDRLHQLLRTFSGTFDVSTGSTGREGCIPSRSSFRIHILSVMRALSLTTLARQYRQRMGIKRHPLHCERSRFLCCRKSQSRNIPLPPSSRCDPPHLVQSVLTSHHE